MSNNTNTKTLAEILAAARNDRFKHTAESNGYVARATQTK